MSACGGGSADFPSDSIEGEEKRNSCVTCATADYGEEIDVIFILTVCLQQIVLELRGEGRRTKPVACSCSSWVHLFRCWEQLMQNSCLLNTRIVCGRACATTRIPYYGSVSSVLLHKSHISLPKLCTNIRNISLFSVFLFVVVDNLATHREHRNRAGTHAVNYFDNKFIEHERV